MDKELKQETCIAANTPEQTQGDVNMMFEPNKTNPNSTKTIIPDNIDIEKSIGTTLIADIKKSPIDEIENCSQLSFPIGENSILSPPKSEPQSTPKTAADASPSSQSESQQSPGAVTPTPMTQTTSSSSSSSTSSSDAKTNTASGFASSTLNMMSAQSKQKTSSGSTKRPSSLTTTPASAVRLVTNGVIPKTGKPLMAAINKKLNKPRGRPRSKGKTIVAMYQSEVL